MVVGKLNPSIAHFYILFYFCRGCSGSLCLPFNWPAGQGSSRFSSFIAAAVKRGEGQKPSLRRCSRKYTYDRMIERRSELNRCHKSATSAACLWNLCLRFGKAAADERAESGLQRCKRKRLLLRDFVCFRVLFPAINHGVNTACQTRICSSSWKLKHTSFIEFFRADVLVQLAWKLNQTAEYLFKKKATWHTANSLLWLWYFHTFMWVSIPCVTAAPIRRQCWALTSLSLQPPQSYCKVVNSDWAKPHIWSWSTACQ